MLGAFLLTEPGAGSDASALSTTAIAHGDSWLLNGEKTWVTNATEANVLRVYAQTEPGSGSRGIGAFLVRADQPGVVREEAYEMLGAHASGTGGFRFHDVELEASQLFSPTGEAFRRAMDAIGLARVVVAAMCVGLLRRGVETAVRYVKNRKAFGAPLSDRQGLRWLLADVATDIGAANGLTQAASAALDTSAPDAAVRTAHAKKFAARVAMDGLAQCMQALGANGFRHDQPLARHMAGAKMAHYVDGTTEVQNLVISGGAVRQPGLIAALRRLAYVTPQYHLGGTEPYDDDLGVRRRCELGRCAARGERCRRLGPSPGAYCPCTRRAPDARL